MTDQRSADVVLSEVGPSSAPAIEPRTPSRKPGPGLIAIITLLGSTGVLAVFGLITGEMYWDGYLSAFGLTTDEFPANAANARIYAYVSVLQAAVALGKGLLDIWPWILFPALLGIVVASLMSESAVKGRLLPKLGVLQRFVSEHSWRGVGARITLLMFAMSCLFVVFAYFCLCAWLVVIAPTRARSLGEENAMQEMTRLLALGKADPTRCSQVDSQPLSGRCVFPIAFGDKTVAVLSADRIYRVPRDTTNLISPAAARRPTQSASAGR